MTLFLDTLHGHFSNSVPFWLMRQAGRYLPEYRALRSDKGGFLEMAFDPKAASEITVQPLRRFSMDAAIIFSDILTIPYALGQDLQFAAGEGPKLPPLRTQADIDRLTYDKFDAVLYPVYQALRATRAQLNAEGFSDKSLIGFAGAPWTVATYMIEGGGSKDYMAVKALAYSQPDLFDALIAQLVDATSRYLCAQIEAGADVVKIFDSWAGVLDEESFQRYAVQPVVQIVDRVKRQYPKVPIIGFPRGAGFNYVSYIQQTGVDCCAVDSMLPLQWVADTLQPLCVIQGTLDPAILQGPDTMITEKISRVLDLFSRHPFIFNLGHGIHKDTSIRAVETLSACVKAYRRG